jgi:hypothetical protein
MRPGQRISLIVMFFVEIFAVFLLVYYLGNAADVAMGQLHWLVAVFQIVLAAVASLGIMFGVNLIEKGQIRRGLIYYHLALLAGLCILASPLLLVRVFA